MRRPVVILLVAALAAGVSACGGGSGARLSKSDYEWRLRPIVREFEHAQSTLGSFAPTDFRAVDAFFARLAGSFRQLHDEVAPLRPPRDVAWFDRRLVEGAGRGADVLERLAARLKAATPADRERILTANDRATLQWLAAASQVEQAVNGIAAKGYRLAEAR
jgi:hypothetical protein